MELLIHHQGKLYAVPRVKDLPLEELNLISSDDIEELAEEVGGLIEALARPLIFPGVGRVSPAPEPLRAITLLGDIDVRNEYG